MENKRRFEYITDAKTAAVILVVLLHCMLFFATEDYYTERAPYSSGTVEYLSNILNSSLVSSLVCCSGFLFAHSVLAKGRTAGALVKSRTKRLLLRYYLYGALWLVPLYTLFDISCWGREYGATWLESYKSMALGVFSDHLWYLLMLYWVSLIFILMIPLIRKDLLAVVGLVAVGLAVIIELFCTFEYFKIGQISTYLPCFFIGVCFYRFRDKIEGIPTPVLWVLTGCFFVTTLFYQRVADIHFSLYWLFKAFGAVFMVLLFMGLDRIPALAKARKVKVISFARQNSLTLYLLNCPFIYIYFRLLAPLTEDNIIICVLANFVLSMMSLLIMAWLIQLCKTRVLRVIKHEQT